ncbi:hypothetical protein D1632_15425 [Chryseobacterium nematophagum]|uniref:Uncharacterized protein n=1 Tax=Chryseobacterium nematophagum TaxID=2305228 RepID=A0A3M7LA90_9FLAO|nr:hypothetical protein [Chryseobacterium nematophagum]RMZ58954.1 hypothetical protein D1632_15425 [Chryseobacterium nematophagum]
MNEHLQIPIEIQHTIDDIMNVPVDFVELPMTAHPKLPQFNRTIRVLNMEAKSKQEFIVLGYEQVLRDKQTGEEINIKLPTPEWIIYKETWSYLLGLDNIPIELPYKDDITKKDKVKIPSYKYMLWLVKNDKAGFLQLIGHYLNIFISTRQEELDQL